MLFNSTEFLLLFLPITLGLYHSVPARFRVPVLCVASLVFYKAADWIPFVFMVVAISWVYLWAFAVERRRTATAVWAAIALPLLILYFFRYLEFTLDTVAATATTRGYFYLILSVVLPAGISFFTFQIVAYAIDVYDGKVPAERHWIKLTTFIAFFPHLIAGPILRYDQLSGQFDRIAHQPALDIDWRKAIKFVAIGLFAKVFIADVSAIMFERFQPSDHPSAPDALISVLLYSFRIYYDFWAYSIIAIGLGAALGVQIPSNFAEPYLALNPKEFWRRWHITLSYWLRDYLYLRLGGNRYYARNILIVFAACGLWHGAGWNFVLWGLYHAFFVLAYVTARPAWDRLPHPVQIVLNFSIVTLGWPLFYLDVSGYLALLSQIFLSLDFQILAYGWRHLLFVGGVAAWTFAAREAVWLYNQSPRFLADTPALHACLVFAALLFFDLSRTFIYFRF